MACSVKRNEQNRIVDVIDPSTGRRDPLYNAVYSRIQGDPSVYVDNDPFLRNLYDQGILQNKTKEEVALGIWSKIHQFWINNKQTPPNFASKTAMESFVEPVAAQTPSETVEQTDIYSQLGSKTQSENVVIDEVKGRKPVVKSNNYYEGNIKPDSNTIFVFGSNPEGRHGAGAAKIATEQFGAIYGQGEGLQGNAYALPTKDLRVKENNGFKSISFEQIVKNIQKLYEVSKQNPNKQFKIAYRNTNEKSLNGYTGLEMIEMFNQSGEIPSNIVFSKEWIDTGKLNQSSKPIVAYRTKGNNFLEALEKDNAIGNPWNSRGYGLYKTNTVKE
jgi:hypothetical protein